MRDKAAEQPAAVSSQRKSNRIGVISLRHVTQRDSVPGRALIYMPAVYICATHSSTMCGVLLGSRCLSRHLACEVGG